MGDSNTRLEKLIEATDKAYQNWRNEPDCEELMVEYRHLKAQLKESVTGMRRALEHITRNR